MNKYISVATKMYPLVGGGGYPKTYFFKKSINIF